MPFARALAWASAFMLACGGSSPSDSPTSVAGQSPSAVPIPAGGGFVSRSVTDATSGITIPVQLFIPGNYDRTRTWPVIVAISGAGDRGNDGVKQTNTGLGLVVQAQPAKGNFPAIVMFPQVPLDTDGDDTGRNAFDRVLPTAISDVVRDYNGDAKRVYLTGLSFGATEGFNLVYEYPTLFAAYVPIAPDICARCVTGDRNTPRTVVDSIAGAKLRTLSLWVFQGADDPGVLAVNTRLLVQVFRTFNPSVQYTEYANMGHEVWDRAYNDPSLYTWLLAQHR